MNDDLLTDDEAMRERGMTDGPRKVAGFQMRPLTALSLSWMQRNRMFDDAAGDPMSKTAAFAFLHSEPKDKIRSVVNDHAKFLNAVDEWIDEHVNHHDDLEPIAGLMAEAFETYMAAKSTGGSDYKGGAKN